MHWQLVSVANEWDWDNDIFMCPVCGVKKTRKEMLATNKSCNCTKKTEKYTKCIKCGRRLRTEESQELGFGPVCYKKWKEETEAYQREWEEATHRRHVIRRLF